VAARRDWIDKEEGRVRGVFLAVFALCFLGACATTETVQQAKGTGEKRTFNAGYERVYKATLSAASKQGLTVTSTDQSRGQILLSHGMTPWSWGERVAIFVTKLADDQTEVEIISKPVVAPLNFPPDWASRLFDAIATELKSQG
jgi:hypothetical protein